MRDLLDYCGMPVTGEASHCPSLWATECSEVTPGVDAEHQLVDFKLVAESVSCCEDILIEDSNLGALHMFNLVFLNL
jgi:hypothetical protein